MRDRHGNVIEVGDIIRCIGEPAIQGPVYRIKIDYIAYFCASEWPVFKIRNGQTTDERDHYARSWHGGSPGTIELVRKNALEPEKAARLMVDAQADNFPRAAADIVVIGSVVGRHISPFSAVYGASKFAVHSLAEALRRDVGPKGVRVSLVEPGIVLSGFQDGAGYNDELVQTFKNKFGPLLIGDDIANAIHYVVTQPPHVHISDIIVRPTRQDYP